MKHDCLTVVVVVVVVAIRWVARSNMFLSIASACDHLFNLLASPWLGPAIEQ